MLTIYEQLKSYCDCLKVSDTVDDKFNTNVNLLIDLISIQTGWKRNNPCENFLSSDREEVFEGFINNSCGCDNGIVTLELFYKEIQEDSFSVVLRIREGIRFKEIEVDNEDFTYDRYTNKLYVDLSKYDVNNPCECVDFDKIIVRYTAGYSLIPQCLLPLFCEYLTHVIEMNRCNCNCSSCENEEEQTEKVMDTIDEYIEQSLFMAYARQLETISLRKERRWFGGMVV